MVVGDDILLIDLLIFGMIEVLVFWLIDMLIFKIMYSVSEDLVIFKVVCGVLLWLLFDIQIGVVLVGIGGGMGYQKLVNVIIGVILVKGEIWLDWMWCLFFDVQLEYVVDDVEYLFVLYDVIDVWLGEFDCCQWLQDDVECLFVSVEYDEECWLYVVMCLVQFMDMFVQMCLLWLLCWCDVQVCVSDKLCSWIFDNELVVVFVCMLLADVDVFGVLMEGFFKVLCKLVVQVWQVLVMLLDDEVEVLLVLLVNDINKQVFKCLQDVVVVCMAELGLFDGVLVLCKYLESYLESCQWFVVLVGWCQVQLELVLVLLLLVG